MTKKKALQYRMLEIDWVATIGADKAAVKFDTETTAGNRLGTITVTTERNSCGSCTCNMDWLSSHGWRLQQVVIPDPVRHPQVTYGLFVKE